MDVHCLLKSRFKAYFIEALLLAFQCYLTLETLERETKMYLKILRSLLYGISRHCILTNTASIRVSSYYQDPTS